MAPSSAAHVVAVTGVSGYIGSEVVKQLLEKGYTVRGTVRSKSNTSKVQHLLKLSDALPGTLELFEADLLNSDDFDEVVRGSDFVLHTASPFVTSVGDPQRDLIDPAVNGTTSVLTAAGKAGIRRVVVTSSVAGKALSIVQLNVVLKFSAAACTFCIEKQLSCACPRMRQLLTAYCLSPCSCQKQQIHRAA